MDGGPWEGGQGTTDKEQRKTDLRPLLVAIFKAQDWVRLPHSHHGCNEKEARGATRRPNRRSISYGDWHQSRWDSNADGNNIFLEVQLQSGENEQNENAGEKPKMLEKMMGKMIGKLGGFPSFCFPSFLSGLQQKK